MMGNMISRIRQTKADGMQFSKSASLSQKKNDMQAFTLPFQEAQKRLSRTLAQSKSMAALGQKVPFDAEEINYALRQVDQDLKNGNFSPKNADRLKISIKKAEQACDSKWKAYIEEQIGGTKSILHSIKGVVSEEYAYKEMRKAELRLSSAEPGSNEAINAMHSYLQHFNNLIEKLQLDDEVLSFLKRLTEYNSVPLSDLSNSCLEKLRSESFSGKLKIVIG